MYDTGFLGSKRAHRLSTATTVGGAEWAEGVGHYFRFGGDTPGTRITVQFGFNRPWDHRQEWAPLRPLRLVALVASMPPFPALRHLVI
jgi:hypothetical protein